MQDGAGEAGQGARWHKPIIAMAAVSSSLLRRWRGPTTAGS
jgi:hypothetical protein